MYCTPPKTLTAKVPHRCTYCGQAIDPGQKYERWASYDEKCYTNKMHPECLEDLSENGDGEYTPYCYDRPELQSNAEITGLSG